MKTVMHKLAIATLVIGSLAVACQDNAAKPEESKEIAEDKNEKKFNTDSSERNAQFVVDAAAGNYAEIKLAELAQQKSTNKEIKDIAKMLQNDHTAALNDLKILASNKSISIPAEEPEKARENIKDLSEAKPAAFDRKWADQLMEKHQQTITDYEKALNDVTDPDIKNWISMVLPTIRTHHDKLMAIDSRLKK